MAGELPKPRIGQDVYVGTELYLSHGEDDFQGGLCRIVTISRDYGEIPFVEVEEQPGSFHNWNYLMENQDRWREDYGDRRGHADPDHRPEFNEGWTGS